MSDAAHSTVAGTTCEECEASGAKPTLVVFIDEIESTLTLCEDCVTEFEAAVLVEEATTAEAA